MSSPHFLWGANITVKDKFRIAAEMDVTVPIGATAGSVVEFKTRWARGEQLCRTGLHPATHSVCAWTSPTFRWRSSMRVRESSGCLCYCRQRCQHGRQQSDVAARHSGCPDSRWLHQGRRRLLGQRVRQVPHPRCPWSYARADPRPSAIRAHIREPNRGTLKAPRHHQRRLLYCTRRGRAAEPRHDLTRELSAARQ